MQDSFALIAAQITRLHAIGITLTRQSIKPQYKAMKQVADNINILEKQRSRTEARDKLICKMNYHLSKMMLNYHEQVAKLAHIDHQITTALLPFLEGNYPSIQLAIQQLSEIQKILQTTTSLSK